MFTEHKARWHKTKVELRLGANRVLKGGMRFILVNTMICQVITRTTAYRGVCLANDTVVRYNRQDSITGLQDKCR